MRSLLRGGGDKEVRGECHAPEEHGLPLLGEQLDDLFHLLLEADVQDAVRLVDDQALQVLVEEVLRVLQVVEQPAGGGGELEEEEE